MNIDTQDLSSYIPGYDDYVDDTKPVYSTKEYYDMKELLESEIEDKEEEIERLNNLLKETSQTLSEQTTKAITLKSENERLHSIIKEVREWANKTIFYFDFKEEITKHAFDLLYTKQGQELLEILEKENK